jgi:hypothetical protein
MHENSTGSTGSRARGRARKKIKELPEDVQNDVDRVADVVAAGAHGPLWEQLASELYAYAFRPLLRAMRRTETLVALTANSKTPLAMNDEERSTLYRSAPDREELAIRTMTAAMKDFPKLLREGGYDPASYPGQGGKPARLTSYFYGRCGLVFPRVFNQWRTERTDRFLLHAVRMGDGVLARALGQAGPDPVPESVTRLCYTLTEMINSQKPRDRAVWLLTVDNLSQDEIADLLDIKTGDVENARYLFRKKVRTQRISGRLHIPPEIEAEWRRAKDKRKQKAGAR